LTSTNFRGDYLINKTFVKLFLSFGRTLHTVWVCSQGISDVICSRAVGQQDVEKLDAEE
jgi:hypothetical protein